MTSGRFFANLMDVLLWQTEQIPHFLQLGFLRGANVEERGDKVSEQPEEGESERAKLGCSQQAGENFWKERHPTIKKNCFNWALAGQHLSPTPEYKLSRPKSLQNVTLLPSFSFWLTFTLRKKFSFCLFYILRKYRWRLFHLPLHCIGHTNPMYFISITNKKTPLTSLFQFLNRKLKQQGLGYGYRLQVKG